ncbi:hypothetical protein BT63DRAFT_81428 [Microthyrium microscopicum]|uniref:Integral membrane protein n=1 Tax=Microthyrium microscopicum TaxID=703497 RepID=A0A6A6U058_9PEZI|nr:hypothetical protein BT63DRAFT_81428 [Microthyrium microscopicum]
MEKQLKPNSPSSATSILKNVGRMFTSYPIWNISWVVAFIYTIGSMIWVLNACFTWLPLVAPSSEFPNEILYGGGITAFFGVLVFEIGSYLLVVESVNAEQTTYFGSAVKQLFGYGLTNPEIIIHSTGFKEPFIFTQKSTIKSEVGRTITTIEKIEWIWFPSWKAMRTRHFYDLAFLSAISQLLGTSVFCISGITGLPGILNHLSRPLTAAIYWTPQTIGAPGFFISGLLILLKNQKQWYKPALKTLDWHVGLWSVFGGVGFILSPVFGYNPATGFHSSLSTFCGSCAFLIASLLQLYGSLKETTSEI